MKTILNNWSVLRGMRLLIGIIILVHSFIQKDIAFGMIAGFLVLTAIGNIGCCGNNGCAINTHNSKKIHKS